MTAAEYINMYYLDIQVCRNQCAVLVVCVRQTAIVGSNQQRTDGGISSTCIVSIVRKTPVEKMINLLSLKI